MLCPVSIERRGTQMNEKGQKKEGLRVIVPGALSHRARYINIHIYKCLYVDIPDPQTLLLPLQLISSSAAVRSWDGASTTAQDLISPLGRG